MILMPTIAIMNTRIMKLDLVFDATKVWKICPWFLAFLYSSLLLAELRCT
jgi:hypothetical protein